MTMGGGLVWKQTLGPRGPELGGGRTEEKIVISKEAAEGNTLWSRLERAGRQEEQCV